MRKVIPKLNSVYERAEGERERKEGRGREGDRGVAEGEGPHLLLLRLRFSVRRDSMKLLVSTSAVGSSLREDEVESKRAKTKKMTIERFFLRPFVFVPKPLSPPFFPKRETTLQRTLRFGILSLRLFSLPTIRSKQGTRRQQPPLSNILFPLLARPPPYRSFFLSSNRGCRVLLLHLLLVQRDTPRTPCSLRPSL